MTTPTISIVTVTQKIVDLLNGAKDTLGIGVVYYGDQELIETTPAVCVEPTHKDNRLAMAAAARRIDPEIEVAVLVYHSVLQSAQANRKEADEFGEAVEAFLNINRTLDGLIIHGYISTFESGYMTKRSSVMRACRLVHTSKTLGYLPS